MVEKHSGTKPSLLIVDDLPAIHEMIKSLVSPSGYLCAGAVNGEDALLRARQSHFDVIIVDFAMTPMDGITLTQELLRFDPKSVVLIMSGFVDKKLQARAKEVGAWHVIEKPFRFDDFLQIVDEAIFESQRLSDKRRPVSPVDWPSLTEHLSARERAYVQLVLEAVKGDREHAARILGVPVDKLDKATS